MSVTWVSETRSPVGVCASKSLLFRFFVCLPISLRLVYSLYAKGVSKSVQITVTVKHPGFDSEGLKTSKIKSKFSHTVNLLRSTVIPMSNATLPLKKWLKYKHLMSALTQNMPPVTQPLLFLFFLCCPLSFCAADRLNYSSIHVTVFRLHLLCVCMSMFVLYNSTMHHSCHHLSFMLEGSGSSASARICLFTRVK